MIIAWTVFVLFYILSWLSIVTGVMDSMGKLDGEPAAEVWLFAIICIIATSVAAQYIWG